MDDGVKHRLSNVIAWAGFAAAMVTLLCAVVWGVFVLQPYKAEQASISAGRSEQTKALAKADSIIDNLARNSAPTEAIEKAQEMRRKLANPLTNNFPLRDAESKRRLRWGNGFALTISASSTAAWLMLGGLNYIFFGAFRALPWKRLEQAEDDV